MTAAQISGTGTVEDDWRPWLAQQLASWPVLDLREVDAPLVVAPHPDDEVQDIEGIKIFVDPKSAGYLLGTQLDFTEGLQGKGFTFHNPNATRSCGCGESFSV